MLTSDAMTSQILNTDQILPKKTCFNDAQTFLIYNRTTIDVNEYKWIQEDGSIPIQNGDIVGVPHFTQFTSR